MKSLSWLVLAGSIVMAVAVVWVIVSNNMPSGPTRVSAPGPGAAPSISQVGAVGVSGTMAEGFIDPSGALDILPIAADGRMPLLGLDSLKVMAFLHNEGYQCSGMESDETFHATWKCTRGQSGQEGYIEAELIGETTSLLYAIKVTTQGSSTADRAALATVATLPYAGAQPAQARTWVEQNLERGGETRIADVPIALVGTTAKSLRIGTE